MKEAYTPRYDFSSLSVQQLLIVRDAWNIHLAHMENVIATAIGRYRIRRDDPDARRPPQSLDALHHVRPPKAPPRTLQNTLVKPWSWPCVLVFVSQWRTQEQMRSDPDQVVPRVLHVKDAKTGQVIVAPTCVILAEEKEAAPPRIRELTFPTNFMGGGYPILKVVQEEQHVGSVACLVRDGDTTYGLTNQHVAGPSGEAVQTLLGGRRIDVGRSGARQASKMPFEEAYPGLRGEGTHAVVDAGLIRLDDVTCWTAQVFGVGELGPPMGFDQDRLTLGLIGCPVRAFGCASGEMRGEIQALFYQYRSMGGVDYVTDLVIGPRADGTPFQTHAGDSGTLWCVDDLEAASLKEAQAVGRAGARARRLRPIAMQWGGHTVLGGADETELQHALATSLTTVCRALDVEVIRDWNIGQREYWGQTGHYKIGAKACELPSNAVLKKLLMNNQERLAFSDEAIANGDIKRDPADGFVALADVADIVWRNTRPDDEFNHFADMDQPGKGAQFGQTTLLKLCEDPRNIDLAVWNGFYDSLGEERRGALPFRVWQLYKLMVEAVQASTKSGVSASQRERAVIRYVATAGVLAHYIGDACQPLHVSFLHHGHPDRPSEKSVHSVFETKMLDRFAPDLIAKVNDLLNGVQVAEDVVGGHDAARSVIDLMQHVLEDVLPPERIIGAFNAMSGQQRVPHMFAELGDDAARCIADGSRRLAAVWQSAWIEGGGAGITAAVVDGIGKISHQAFKDLYDDPKFAPSFILQDMQTMKILP
jgi:hypothetical protein